MEGFEPATGRLEIFCSVQLSYTDKEKKPRNNRKERFVRSLVSPLLSSASHICSMKYLHSTAAVMCKKKGGATVTERLLAMPTGGPPGKVTSLSCGAPLPDY